MYIVYVYDTCKEHKAHVYMGLKHGVGHGSLIEDLPSLPKGLASVPVLVFLKYFSEVSKPREREEPCT
jgi:hypothetical protein